MRRSVWDELSPRWKEARARADLKTAVDDGVLSASAKRVTVSLICNVSCSKAGIEDDALYITS